VTAAPAELTVDRVLLACRTVSTAQSLDHERAVQTVLGELRDASGAAACVLSDRGPEGDRSPDIVVSDAPGSSLDPALVLDLAIPIHADLDGRLLAEVSILSRPGASLAGSRRIVAECLAEGLTSLVRREHASREASARASESDAMLLDALMSIRAAEDQISNSIGVVLGWLRLAQDNVRQAQELPDHLATALRRLQDAQAGVTEFLRLTQAQAIRRHASDRVDVAELWPGAEHQGETAVRANRAHLTSLLEQSPPITHDQPAWSPDGWTLRLAVPLTSELLTAIAASGGSVDIADDGATVRWARWTGR